MTRIARKFNSEMEASNWVNSILPSIVSNSTTLVNGLWLVNLTVKAAARRGESADHFLNRIVGR